jgi:hypothetical protein
MNETLFAILFLSIGCAIGFALAQYIDKRGWELYDVYTTAWEFTTEGESVKSELVRYEIMHKKGVYKVDAYGYNAKFHSGYSTVIDIIKKLNKPTT